MSGGPIRLVTLGGECFEAELRSVDEYQDPAKSLLNTRRQGRRNFPRRRFLANFRFADDPPAIAWARMKGEKVRPGVLLSPEYVNVAVQQGLRLGDIVCWCDRLSLFRRFGCNRIRAACNPSAGGRCRVSNTTVVKFAAYRNDDRPSPLSPGIDPSFRVGTT